jgi:gas vesicle protein
MSQFSKGYAFGLLTGALAGSVVALLFAPEKGSVLRKRLSYQVNRMAEEISDTIRQLQSNEAAPDSASHKLVADAQSKAEDLIREAEDLLKTLEKKD